MSGTQSSSLVINTKDLSWNTNTGIISSQSKISAVQTNQSDMSKQYLTSNSLIGNSLSGKIDFIECNLRQKLKFNSTADICSISWRTPNKNYESSVNQPTSNELSIDREQDSNLNTDHDKIYLKSRNNDVDTKVEIIYLD